jgi:hypothetical protein
MAEGRRGGANSYRVISGGAGDPLILAGTADPSSGGLTAPEGSIYMRYVAAGGQVYYKTGSGDTAWAQSDPSGGTPQLGYGGLYTHDVGGTTYDFIGTTSWTKQTACFEAAGPSRDCVSNLTSDRIELPARAASWFVNVTCSCSTDAGVDTGAQFAIYLEGVRQEHLIAQVMSNATTSFDYYNCNWSIAGVIEADASDHVELYAHRNNSGTYYPNNLYTIQMTVTELG